MGSRKKDNTEFKICFCCAGVSLPNRCTISSIVVDFSIVLSPFGQA